MLHKVLAKIQEIIGIAKFDNTKILTDTDNELPDDITIKNVVIIIICIIKMMVNFMYSLSKINLVEV